ncbi:hypothetical protein BT69DRAFT_1352001 [Atractiella rhizophila]|nr:hypothetical protein BT69DRAFT_1352001 [Atractiella rhizophila]
MLDLRGDRLVCDSSPNINILLAICVFLRLVNIASRHSEEPLLCVVYSLPVRQIQSDHCDRMSPSLPPELLSHMFLLILPYCHSQSHLSSNSGLEDFTGPSSFSLAVGVYARSLSNCALVCASWRDPAQRLLMGLERQVRFDPRMGLGERQMLLPATWIREVVVKSVTDVEMLERAGVRWTKCRLNNRYASPEEFSFAKLGDVVERSKPHETGKRELDVAVPFYYLSSPYGAWCAESESAGLARVAASVGVLALSMTWTIAFSAYSTLFDSSFLHARSISLHTFHLSADEKLYLPPLSYFSTMTKTIRHLSLSSLDFNIIEPLSVLSPHLESFAFNHGASLLDVPNKIFEDCSFNALKKLSIRGPGFVRRDFGKEDEKVRFFDSLPMGIERFEVSAAPGGDIDVVVDLMLRRMPQWGRLTWLKLPIQRAELVLASEGRGQQLSLLCEAKGVWMEFDPPREMQHSTNLSHSL